MALSGDAWQEFRPETVLGTEGFFRVGQTRAGGWSLIDPAGRRFFACGVNEVDGIADSPHEPAARLRAWGFNLLGAGAAPALREVGLPFVATVNFCAAAPTIRAGGARLPDVFDPGWRGTAMNAAAACAAWSTQPELLGWLADDALDWAKPEAGGRPSLLQICLSLEPSFAAYHAAWEFVLALHGGNVERLGRAWGMPLKNKETVRELTRAEQGVATRGYLRDNLRWTRECAERYFTATSAAIRAHDPNHLLLGARARRGRVTLEAPAPGVDVPWIPWAEAGGGSAGGGPVLAGDFSWVSPDFYGLPAGGRAHGQTSVERMLRRGRAALRRLAMDPAVVGYTWRQWRDAPGEQPPFAGGLVHTNDVEAREHTELVADINGKAGILRGFGFAPTAS